MAAMQSDASQRSLWEWLEPLGSPIAFRRHSLIYTPGQPAQTFYLLRAGQVNLQILSSGGRGLTLKVVEPGQCFGHSALASSPTYDSSAEVIKPVRAVAVSRDAVLSLLAREPAASLKLIEELGRYRLTVSRRLDEVAFKSVPARLASLLLDMADTASDGQQSRLPPRTHQQLAEMVNAYRETVTKIINQFRAARILDVDRSGITLLNPSRLRELAQS